ncbi:hypothetical protein AB0J63_34390 [Streptosporangium canum]|uniref:hypothetical protein n=1 Tax=Streptosporangium canum TaxID=324952 RepID=UPI0034326219
MTKDKAKKADIRERMDQTGEPYNVARRALEGTAPPPQTGSHVIADEETRRIAENFLSSSPWNGDVTWDKIVIGPYAEWLSDDKGNFAPSTKLSESDRWSWRVTFVDPSGKSCQLIHDSVLHGLRELVYGDEEKTGIAGFELLSVKQWFTEPAVDRRKLTLSDGDSSRICQHALYGRQVFRTNDHVFGATDYFAEQRTPPTED